jgi:transposase-like protein
VPSRLQYPISRHRELQHNELQHKWQQARENTIYGSATPQNDNHEGGGRCPFCQLIASIAPIRSDYRGKGLIHHHWHCNSCGHDWTTASRVPA